MHTIHLPEEYAMILQQVDEIGEEDFEVLAESVGVDRPRLSHIIQALRNRGLLHIRYTAQDTWISLSSRGQRLMSQLWSDGSLGYGY